MEGCQSEERDDAKNRFSHAVGTKLHYNILNTRPLLSRFRLNVGKPPCGTRLILRTKETLLRQKEVFYAKQDIS